MQIVPVATPCVAVKEEADQLCSEEPGGPERNGPE